MKLSQALLLGAQGRTQIFGALFKRNGNPTFNNLPRLEDGRIDKAALAEIDGCCALGAIALGCAAEFDEPIPFDDADHDPEGLGESKLIIAATGTNIRQRILAPNANGQRQRERIIELYISSLNDGGSLDFQQIAERLEELGL